MSARPEPTEKWISDLVGTFTDPIIVMPGGWGETLPETIKRQITLERLIENIKRTKGLEPTGTDAEAAAYLYTASLQAPIDSHWTRIYLYVAGRVMGRQEVEIPEGIRVENLDDYDMRKLDALKAWIYRQRIAVRLDRERAARRQEKEQRSKEVKQLQPSLFAEFEFTEEVRHAKTGSHTGRR
jgi:hypothetical protein